MSFFKSLWRLFFIIFMFLFFASIKALFQFSWFIPFLQSNFQLSLWFSFFFVLFLSLFAFPRLFMKDDDYSHTLSSFLSVHKYKYGYVAVSAVSFINFLFFFFLNNSDFGFFADRFALSILFVSFVVCGYVFYYAHNLETKHKKFLDDLFSGKIKNEGDVK